MYPHTESAKKPGGRSIHDTDHDRGETFTHAAVRPQGAVIMNTLSTLKKSLVQIARFIALTFHRGDITLPALLVLSLVLSVSDNQALSFWC